MATTTRRTALVTGATGFLGRAIVRQLCKDGYHVRALSRSRADAADPFASLPSDSIERIAADVTDESALRGAAEGADVVVHLAGILHRGEQDYEAVHVRGTANVLAEASRAGVRRFIHMSCLGVDAAASDYHRTKFNAEELVKAHSGEWVILRPSIVYGPRDETVSLLLRMVRAVPVVPVPGKGDQRVQLLWHEDLAAAVLASIDGEHAGRTLYLAGDDVASPRELVDRLGTLVDRPAKRLRFPASLAPSASRVLGALGITPPLNRAKLAMLEEESVVGPQHNSLRDLGVTPTSLEEGLRRIATELPEQLPSEGFGRLMHKVYEARVEGSTLGPSEMMSRVRNGWQQIMLLDFHAERQADYKPELGANLVANLPPRGHVHMRVVESGPERISLSTLSGHPIAGVVRFSSHQRDGALYFRIDVYARASNRLDQVALQTLGRPMQHLNWTEVVRRAIKHVGGTVRGGVRATSHGLSGQAAREAEQELRALIDDYHRQVAA